MLVSEIIDRCYSEWLYPAGVDRPALDFLASIMTGASPTQDGTFTTEGNVNAVPPDSVVEIDSELILLKGFTIPTAVVAERGYYNTVAANHAIKAQVRIDPKYPRATLFNHLKSVIGMLKPWGLYAKGTDDTQLYTERAVLQLPTGGEKILSVLVRSLGADEQYVTLRREGYDWVLYREFFPSKYWMRRGGASGNEMVVSFTKDFTMPTTEADDLDDSGVPTGLQPYIPMGVAGMALQEQGDPAGAGRGDPPDAGDHRCPGRDRSQRGTVDAPDASDWTT